MRSPTINHLDMQCIFIMCYNMYIYIYLSEKSKKNTIECRCHVRPHLIYRRDHSEPPILRYESSHSFPKSETSRLMDFRASLLKIETCLIYYLFIYIYIYHYKFVHIYIYILYMYSYIILHIQV